MKKLLFALTIIFTLSGLVSVANAVPLSTGDIISADPSYPISGIGGIFHFSSTGTQKALYQSSFFAEPIGVAIDHDGNIIIANSHGPAGNAAILKLDPVTGMTTIVSPAGNFVTPRNVVIDSSGNIFVADKNAFGNGGVIKVDPNTGMQTTVFTSSDPNMHPDYITMDKNGNLLITYVSLTGFGGGVIRINPITGTFNTISSGGNFYFPQGIVANDNYIFVADNSGKIIRVDPTTGGQTVIASGYPLACPTGLTFDNNGNLLVNDPCQEPGATISVNLTTGSKTILTLYGSSPSGIMVYLPPLADSTPPVIVPTITGTLGNNGWYTSDVTVSWSVTDTESVISSSTGCTTSTINTDTAGTTLTCTATSTGGTSIQSVTIKRDATAPTIAGAPTTAPNTNDWYNSDVIVHYTATDSLSGLVSSPADTVISTEGLSQSTSQTVTDLAGNTATATVSGINLDKTPPTITAPSGITLVSTTPVSPPLGAPTVSDNLDPSPIVTNNAPASFASGSTSAVTWTAADHAGNSATATQQVTIQTPAQAITGLTNTIDSMSLPTGEQTSLGATLKNIDTSSPSSCGKLNAFVSKINNDLSHGKLTVSEANILLSQANAIKAAIGCK